MKKKTILIPLALLLLIIIGFSIKGIIMKNTTLEGTGKFDKLIKEYCEVVMLQPYSAYKTTDECFSATKDSGERAYVQCLENKSNDPNLGSEKKCDEFIKKLYQGLINAYKK